MALILGFRHLFGGRSTTIYRSGCLAPLSIRGLCTILLTKLYVGGLSGNTNEHVVRDAFSRYGQLLHVDVKVNPQTGWSKGYGFVQFACEKEADNALNKMDGQVLNGKTITVNFAKPDWQNIGVDPPRAVGPPSFVLEKTEEEEKVGKKGKEKNDFRRAAVSPSQSLEKNEKKEKKEKKGKKEKNENKEKKEKKGKKEKKEKKKKRTPSLEKQTFIEDLDD